LSNGQPNTNRKEFKAFLSTLGDNSEYANRFAAILSWKESAFVRKKREARASLF